MANGKTFSLCISYYMNEERRMAEKKKKITIPFKETAVPKHPVILKSDRETPKEVIKEKPEKEKQPTIILKTREQSTPKDERPPSPKSTGDIEIYQPCKIVQNDNKDRKIIEQRPYSIKQMSESVKLLDENLEFNSAAMEFLTDSSTEYLVVGIVGAQGVGKSMIMNIIAQNKPVDGLCQFILNATEQVVDYEEPKTNFEDNLEELSLDELPEPNNHEMKEDRFMFKMQNFDQFEKGSNCTKGIDMYVTSDRVILLDCQSMWSLMWLEDTNLNPISSRSTNVVTTGLQLTSFLMAVCHVVIAVQDWFVDYNFMRYIQTAEMLKPSLSAANPAASAQENGESPTNTENHPHLLMFQNRCQLEDFTPEAVRTMQDVYRQTFLKSNMQLQSGMYMYNESSRSGLSTDQVCNHLDTERCGRPVNLFLLPEIYEDYDNRNIYRGHPPIEHLAQRLRRMVLGVHRHAITNVPNLSEKGWFHYCNKAWETIRKCTFFMEYERFLP